MPARVRALAPVFADVLHSLKGEPHVTDIRNIGLAGALQIAARDGDPLVRPYEMGVACWQDDLYVRWGGDTLQFAPPLTSTPEDLQRMGEVLHDVVHQVE